MINKILFKEIVTEAQKLGLPTDKKRAIIREYLQSKFLYTLYSQKSSEKLSLIGGTGLRLLRGLDRFSEDLDFDNLGLTFFQIKNLFLNCVRKIDKENLKIGFDFKKTDHSGIGRLRFTDLLYILNISTNPREKLMIKLDYTTPKIKPKQDVITLNRFGFLQNIVTGSLESILSQKIMAIFTRKDLQPRDFYDVAWLLSHHISVDLTLLKPLKIKNERELWTKILNHFQKIKSDFNYYKNRLLPFLINSEKIRNLELFENLIKTKIKTFII